MYATQSGAGLTAGIGDIALHRIRYGLFYDCPMLCASDCNFISTMRGVELLAFIRFTRVKLGRWRSHSAAKSHFRNVDVDQSPHPAYGGVECGRGAIGQSEPMRIEMSKKNFSALVQLASAFGGHCTAQLAIHASHALMLNVGSR